MTNASESGSRYLSLALSARRVMGSLRPVASGAPVVGDLGESLKYFMSEVQTSSMESYVNRLTETGSIPSFEEVSTFDDVAKEFGAEKLRAAFESLLDVQGVTERGGSAWELIKFFGAVESQALDQYAACLQARMA